MTNREYEIQSNLISINRKINEACIKSDRSTEKVKMIAVSKFFSVEDILIAKKLGVQHFGESRIQEFSKKFEKIGNKVTWHQIGHVQSNKVRYVIDKVDLIHSACSIKLIENIQLYAEKNGSVSKILLQVNISQEKSKFGFLISDVESLLEQISNYKNIRVKGLMTIAPFTENSENSRQIFSNLRLFAERIKNKNIPNIDMEELSMGMSNDFDVAIEEGSTMVRIGTSLFGERNQFENRSSNT